MFLSGVVIAGGAVITGTLGASVKVYRENKRKREMPWTVAAERMAKNELALAKGRRKSLFGAQEGMIDRVTSSIRGKLDRSQALTQQIIAPFVSNTRRQQMQEISAISDEVEISETEKKARKELAFASVTFALAVGGSLFYPPLYWPTTLGLIYYYEKFYKLAYQALFKERRLSADVLHAVFATGAIAGGFIVAAAFSTWYVMLMRLFLVKTEDHTKKSFVNLFGEQPRSVWVLVDGVDAESVEEVEIPFENLQIGDIIAVGAGQMIPIDGTIVAGLASIDQHMLTGEAQPIPLAVRLSCALRFVRKPNKSFARYEKAVKGCTSSLVTTKRQHVSSHKSWALTTTLPTPCPKTRPISSQNCNRKGAQSAS